MDNEPLAILWESVGAVSPEARVTVVTAPVAVSEEEAMAVEGPARAPAPPARVTVVLKGT